jgi:cytochrome P450
MSYDKTDKVLDWATDFDHGSQEWADDPYAIIKELKNAGCPIAHTERYGGMWVPTTYDMIKQIFLDTKNFSSEGTIIREERPYQQAIFLKETASPIGIMPPITSDPPFHKIARNLLSPIFSPDVIALWHDEIGTTCNGLMRSMENQKSSELMHSYCNRIPSIIIAKMLGIPEQDIDKFDDWVTFFMHDINEPPSRDRFIKYLKYKKYMENHVDDHIKNPKKDIISYLLSCNIEDETLSIPYLIGIITLILVAGVHTVSSVMGSSLWHLATNPVDRRRLVENPDMIPAAVEEFLRAYAPVTIARLLKEDIEFHGVQMKKEDWVLLSLPAANRDEKQFANAHEVIIDREDNRHAAFGLGVHSCLGSSLARLELKVAISTFLENFPNFWVDPHTEVKWSTGQVRGPLNLSLIFGDDKKPGN